MKTEKKLGESHENFQVVGVVSRFERINVFQMYKTKLN